MTKSNPSTGTHKFEHALMSHVKDSITGFEGVITRAAQYLTGCDRYCVQPKKLNKTTGLPVEAAWFECWRLHRIAILVGDEVDTLTSKIPLGATAVDKVTGTEGVVVCRTLTPGADNRISLSETKKKGSDKYDVNWLDFDECSLTIKGTKIISLVDTDVKKPACTGGPNSHPAPRN